MLSDTTEAPTLDTLWNYLSHFYDRIEPDKRDQFAFEDLAGIYTEGDASRLFAVCVRHGEAEDLKVLPAGPYLCGDCTEGDRARVLEGLLREAEETYRVSPSFTVQLVVISGILQWKYQVQLYVGGGEHSPHTI